MAVEARLAAKVVGEPLRVRVMGYDGKPIAAWQADRDRMLRFYGVPSEQRDASKVVVQLHLGEDATSDVRTYQGRKLAWRWPSKPAKSPRRRALSHKEPSSNGLHGRRDICSSLPSCPTPREPTQ